MTRLRQHIFVFITAVVALLFVFGCGGSLSDRDEGGNDDASISPVDAAGPADDDDQPGDDDDQPGDQSNENIDNDHGDGIYTLPMGDNPAMEYGPYEVEVRVIDLPNEKTGGRSGQTAYFYIPKGGAHNSAPFPTIVWGHGMLTAYHPEGQQEIFYRQASKGYLVIYPNMEVPINFSEHNILNNVMTYLQAAREAVRLGAADPEHIVFGGYSMGGRVAALATALTTSLDPLNLWPDPEACIYEAMRDVSNAGGWWVEMGIPGPQPSDWASLIDSSIPQTVIVAEEDAVNPNYDPVSGEPINGVYFFRQLQSDFAQLITLKSGTTRRDEAAHDAFHAMDSNSLDALDLWGHMKIVAGVASFHFASGSRHWAYGFMRGVGGLDHNNVPIIHEVYEMHYGVVEAEAEPAPETSELSN